jgi:hypothetical protein
MVSRWRCVLLVGNGEVYVSERVLAAPLLRRMCHHDDESGSGLKSKVLSFECAVVQFGEEWTRSTGGEGTTGQSWYCVCMSFQMYAATRTVSSH